MISLPKFFVHPATQLRHRRIELDLMVRSSMTSITVIELPRIAGGHFTGAHSGSAWPMDLTQVYPLPNDLMTLQAVCNSSSFTQYHMATPDYNLLLANLTFASMSGLLIQLIQLSTPVALVAAAMLPEPLKSPTIKGSCDCGSAKCGLPTHSSWCSVN